MKAQTNPLSYGGTPKGSECLAVDRRRGRLVEPFHLSHDWTTTNEWMDI